MSRQLAVHSKHIGVEVEGIIEEKPDDQVGNHKLDEAEEQGVTGLHLEDLGVEQRQPRDCVESGDGIYFFQANLFGVGAVAHWYLDCVDKILAAGAHLSGDVSALALYPAYWCFVAILMCFDMNLSFVIRGWEFIDTV